MRILTKIRILAAAVTIGAVTAPSSALAQSGYAWNHTRPVGGRPSQIEIFPNAPLNQRIDPRADASWKLIANSYRAALEFAECARKFDREAMQDLVSRPIGHLNESADMSRVARKYRACVGEAGAVAPILLRVAVAETALKDEATLPAQAAVAVGVPEVVEGYPLGQVARCQARAAPDRVRQLLRTRPGTAEERKAAEDLFTSLPQCGTAGGLGRVQPTAARLALVDAAFARR